MFPLRDDRPTYTAPVVTTLLIVACALVFFFELSLDDYSRDYFINVYGVVPAHLRPITLLTSLFIHGGWSHIIGNMLFLWAFGKSLEDAHGAYEVSRLLPDLRRRRRHHSCGLQCLHDAAHGGSQRRHRGRHGRRIW